MVNRVTSSFPAGGHSDPKPNKNDMNKRKVKRHLLKIVFLRVLQHIPMQNLNIENALSVYCFNFLCIQIRIIITVKVLF